MEGQGTLLLKYFAANVTLETFDVSLHVMGKYILIDKSFIIHRACGSVRLGKFALYCLNSLYSSSSNTNMRLYGAVIT